MKFTYRFDRPEDADRFEDLREEITTARAELDRAEEIWKGAWVDHREDRMYELINGDPISRIDNRRYDLRRLKEEALSLLDGCTLLIEMPARKVDQTMLLAMLIGDGRDLPHHCFCELIGTPTSSHQAGKR
ncbi:hypothetical protein [Labrys neptuniae]|uniref:Uncharacterized protein n=1 Tax=Labrys neptuniae TaxID=376174 RepID=A0ABV3PJ12_9HYPH